MSPRNTTRTERRTVRSDDPTLSDEANDLLTREAREIVGADVVEVPAGTPRRQEEAHAGHSRLAATIASVRPVFIVMACAGVVIAAIVALSTDQYLVLVGVFALLILALVVVATGAVQLTTEMEHVDPSVAARLEQEGVPDPDRLVRDLVEDFAGAQEAGGAPEVMAPGHNRNDGSATTGDPARSTVRQQTALTPSSSATKPAGSGSAVAALPWWVALGATVASVIGAIAGGGRFWVAAAVVVPLGIGWALMQRWMSREGDGGSATPQRAAGDDASLVRKVAPDAAYAVVLVVVILLVYGWAAELL